jgi:hypothetical protein
MLADDRARQSIDSAVLARAIAAVGAGAAPRGDVPSAAELSVRIERLDLPALPLTAEALVIGAALALVGVPTALLLAPALVFVVP